MILNFATCAACLLFLQGLCECYSGTPRATADCLTCKCVTLWHVMKTKKKARKNLYHMGKNKTCTCNVSCRLTGRSKCTVAQGKYSRVAYHPTCMKYWTQCEHMEKVTKQLEEYSAALELKGFADIPEVLAGCCPLIGYDKKRVPLFKLKILVILLRSEEKPF